MLYIVLGTVGSLGAFILYYLHDLHTGHAGVLREQETKGWPPATAPQYMRERYAAYRARTKPPYLDYDRWYYSSDTDRSPPQSLVPIPQPKLPEPIPTQEEFIHRVFDGLKVPKPYLHPFEEHAQQQYESDTSYWADIATLERLNESADRLRGMFARYIDLFPIPDQPTPLSFIHNLPLVRLRRATSPAYLHIPLTLPLDERGAGTWICCPPNSGKTNLMHGLALADVKRVAAGQASLIIMDSKAHKAESLIDPWLNVDFETLDPRLKGRVYVFDPEIHPAINICDLGAVDPLISLFRYMFTSLVEGMTLTGYQSTLLIKCIHAVKANPNPSVLGLYDILSNGWEKYEPGIRKLRQNHRDFFLKLRPDARNPKRMVCDFDSSTYFEQRTQVRARLDNLLSAVDLLYDTLASTETKINLPQLLDQGSIILIPAKTDVLGDAGSELYQRMWTMLILDAARKRKKGKEHPVFTFIDEAHKGIARDTRFSDTLDECRSAGIALTVAHPREGNIKDADVLDALRNDCRIHFTSAGKKGTFNARIGNEDKVVQCELTRIDRLPQLSKRRQAERLEQMRARFGAGAAHLPPRLDEDPAFEYEEPPRKARKPKGPPDDFIDVEWEDITEDEPPRRRPRKLPPPPASSTDFEL